MARHGLGGGARWVRAGGGLWVMGVRGGRVPGWVGVGGWLIVAGPVALALAVLCFATFTPTIEGVQHGVAGLTERILVLELQAWYVALGWLAFRGGGLRSDQHHPAKVEAAVA